jgi:hypothetical protein
MRRDRGARAKVALTVLVLFAVASGAELAIRSTIQYVHRESDADRVTRYDARYVALRAVLPGHGIIGYVSDAHDGRGFTSLDGMREYFMTQYSLAPIVVVVGAESGSVVGNFRDPDALRDAPGLERLGIVHDFGDGVLLLGRGPR